MAKNVALLVNDIQKDINAAFGHTDAFKRMVANAARLVTWARGSGIPVIYSRLGFRPDYLDATGKSAALLKQFNILQRDTPGADFVDEVAPKAGEFVITRRRTSQFYQTELELILRTLGVNTVVITGCSTDHSVSSFARDGSDRDLRVIVAADGCSPSSPQFQEPALAIIADFFGEVKSTDEIMREFAA